MERMEQMGGEVSYSIKTPKRMGQRYHHLFEEWADGLLAEALNVDQYFAVAHPAWMHETVERYNQKIIIKAKAILGETGRGAICNELVKIIPVVQWTLNPLYRKRIRLTPFQVMRGRAPPTLTSVLRSVGVCWGGQLKFPPGSTSNACLMTWLRSSYRRRSSCIKTCSGV